MDSKGAGGASALDVSASLLRELLALKGTTSWQRKLVSCVSQVQSTLKRMENVKMTGIVRAKVTQLHMVMEGALAIVVQHGSFQTKFLHAQWDREMSVALRHLWKFHIELLLAARLEEEVMAQPPESICAGHLRLGQDLDVFECGMGSLDYDAESSEGSFPDLKKLAPQL